MRATCSQFAQHPVNSIVEYHTLLWLRSMFVPYPSVFAPSAPRARTSDRCKSRGAVDGAGDGSSTFRGSKPDGNFCAGRHVSLCSPPCLSHSLLNALGDNFGTALNIGTLTVGATKRFPVGLKPTAGSLSTCSSLLSLILRSCDCFGSHVGGETNLVVLCITESWTFLPPVMPRDRYMVSLDDVSFLLKMRDLHLTCSHVTDCGASYRPQFLLRHWQPLLVQRAIFISCLSNGPQNRSTPRLKMRLTWL